MVRFKNTRRRWGNVLQIQHRCLQSTTTELLRPKVGMPPHTPNVSEKLKYAITMSGNKVFGKFVFVSSAVLKTLFKKIFRSKAEVR